MKDIYSDIRGQILKTNDKYDSTKVYLYDTPNGLYKPNLIIPNQIAIRKLMAFLDDCLWEITRNRYERERDHKL